MAAHMNFYVSPHDAAIAAERRCPHCSGTGRRLDFLVSGMRVVAPCDCPLGRNAKRRFLRNRQSAERAKFMTHPSIGAPRTCSAGRKPPPHTGAGSVRWKRSWRHWSIDSHLARKPCLIRDTENQPRPGSAMRAAGSRMIRPLSADGAPMAAPCRVKRRRCRWRSVGRWRKRFPPRSVPPPLRAA